MVNFVSTYTKDKRSAKDLSNDAYAVIVVVVVVFVCIFGVFFFLYVFDFLYKNMCCWYSFELPQFVEAIQMSTNNKRFYKEIDTCCNLKTTKFLDYALVLVCAVIGSNTVFGKTSLSHQCRRRGSTLCHSFSSV